MKDPPKKGELNEDFGFYVERPFHLVSLMPSRRYLDVVENTKVVIKTPNSYDSQVWWFDQKSKTVQNMKYKNVSLSGENKGRSRKMQLYKTNSDWF